MGALRASLMLKTSARLIPRLTSLVPGIYSKLDREGFCAKTLAAMTRSGSVARRGHSHRPWALSGTTSQATRSCPPSDAALLIGFSGPPEEEGSAASSACSCHCAVAAPHAAPRRSWRQGSWSHPPSSIGTTPWSVATHQVRRRRSHATRPQGAAGSRTILPTAYPAPRPRTALGKSAGRGFLLALGGGEYCQHQRAGQGERRRVAGAGGEQAEDGRAGTV